MAKEPAREAIARRRESDQLLASLRGGDWQELPGTRFEVARLASHFEGSAVTPLVDSEASEQRLAEMRESG